MMFKIFFSVKNRLLSYKPLNIKPKNSDKLTNYEYALQRSHPSHTNHSFYNNVRELYCQFRNLVYFKSNDYIKKLLINFKFPFSNLHQQHFNVFSVNRYCGVQIIQTKF